MVRPVSLACTGVGGCDLWRGLAPWLAQVLAGMDRGEASPPGLHVDLSCCTFT